MAIYKGHKEEQKALVDKADEIELEHIDEPANPVVAGSDLAESLTQSVMQS